MENALGVMIVLSGVAIFFAVKTVIFFERLKRSRVRQNYFIGMLLRNGIVEYNHKVSLLCKLTLLKHEYCVENKGSEADFLFDARTCIQKIVESQTEGNVVYGILVENKGYVDPAIEKAAQDAFSVKDGFEKKLLDTFEQTYEVNNGFEGHPQELESFIKKLRHPYFRETRLYARFYNRIQHIEERALA